LEQTVIQTVPALKEWAVHIRALASGDQIVILRKGGIAEETRHFSVQSERFYLYPTYEHQKAALIREPYQSWIEPQSERERETARVTITLYAEVVEDLLIHDESTLTELAPFHIGTATFAAERLHWKRQQPLHALVLRVYKLRTPLEVDVRAEYAGCKSWLELPLTLPAGEQLSDPVYNDETFAEQLHELKRRIHS
jgi:hypothetical protein